MRGFGKMEELIKDKKAISLLGQKVPISFFVLFMLLPFILAGIVLPVYAFYSYNIDVREIEVNLIASRIANCMIKDGVLQDVSSLSLEKCGLNLNLEENYINITLEDKSIYFGRETYEVFCKLKGVTMQYKPTCLWQKYYAVKENSESANVDLLVATIKGMP
jgi:hypothetical protein